MYISSFYFDVNVLGNKTCFKLLNFLHHHIVECHCINLYKGVTTLKRPLRFVNLFFVFVFNNNYFNFADKIAEYKANKGKQN